MFVNLKMTTEQWQNLTRVAAVVGLISAGAGVVGFFALQNMRINALEAARDFSPGAYDCSNFAKQLAQKPSPIVAGDPLVAAMNALGCNSIGPR